MGLIGDIIIVIVGAIAGFIRLSPFVISTFLKGKPIPEYEEVEELGADLLKHFNYKCKTNGTEEVGFVDDYVTSVNGIRLHLVVDNGKCRVEGKRPIVFVHGFPEHWISWLDQMEHFAAKGHPIVALNMRGYAKSDKPLGMSSYHLYDCLVEDIRATVKYASLLMGSSSQSSPLLIAHDWGASICWSYVNQFRTTENKEICGYISLTLPPPEAFEANMNLTQVWASLYMLFFNMPWAPEWYFTSNKAKNIARIFIDTMQAKDYTLPTWKINVYRSNCLQKYAMTSQLNYYRSVLQEQPKPVSPQDVLGPKNHHHRRLGTTRRPFRGALQPTQGP